MKKIYYKFNAGTDENLSLVPVKMTYSDVNLETAKKEAYNGEYTIEEEDEL